MELALCALPGKPESLTDTVYKVLSDAITDRSRLPGRRITEAGLAKALNVSKTPVREALLRLQHVGLVVAETNRGARVVLPSASLVENAYEVRCGLEQLAAQLAAIRATSDEGSLIQDAATSSLNSACQGDDEAFRNWDSKFHRAIAELRTTNAWRS